MDQGWVRIVVEGSGGGRIGEFEFFVDLADEALAADDASVVCADHIAGEEGGAVDHEETHLGVVQQVL